MIRNYIEIIENAGGEVCLVKLTTSKEILEKRVVEESRKKYEKMRSAESLNRWIEKYKLFEEIPNKKSLVIDNTDLSPEQVARKIMDHFCLNDKLKR